MTEDEIMKLPLAQYLILELLTARYRLGEGLWTLPARTRPQCRALEELGLVGWKEGIIEKTLLAWLTTEGKNAMIDPKYQPPRGS